MTGIEMARWVLGSLLCLAGAYVALCNWAGVILASTNRRRGIDRGYSAIPFFSPALAGTGLALLPIEKGMLWFLLLLDLGTLIFFIYLPFLIELILRDKGR